MAAGPIAAKATCIIVAIAVVIPFKALMPTADEAAKLPPIFGKSPIKFEIPLSNSFIGPLTTPPMIPEKLVKPLLNNLIPGSAASNAKAPPTTDAKGIKGLIADVTSITAFLYLIN